MSREQLSEYIIKNIKKGYTMDSLRFSLISQGYSRITVDSAIELANKKMAEDIPKIKEKPEISYRIIAEEDDSLIQTKRIEDQSNNKKGFLKRLFG